jgi:predicted O-linked N-acetylglucosamine transferase (SPINDLY family)
VSRIDQLLQAALAHHQAGRLAEAEAIYRQVLVEERDQPDALQLLGFLAHQCGHHQQAIDLIRRAMALRPGEATYHNNLATALMALNRLDEAEMELRRALDLKPDADAIRMNLANLLRDAGRIDEAIEQYGQIDTAGACMVRGALLQQRGRLADAAAAWRRATELDPMSADAHSNLAQALAWLGDASEEAVRAGEEAVRLQPDLAEAWNNLGVALKSAGRHDHAARAFERAIELQPQLPAAQMNLGNLWLPLGEVERAEAHYRRAIELSPTDGESWDNLLLALHYREREPLELFAEHSRWGELFSSTAAPRAFENPRDPERRLRIGYVSPDFRRHSVAYFIEPILAGHDRGQFEVFCYANLRREDEVTERLRSLPALTWRSIHGRSNDEAAAMIRDDAIDLLIDLAGHTGDNRLGVFARRPAPVQFTYLGYPNTTGLREIDYRITDPIADPPGESDTLHTERLLRLPTSAWCYRPPVEALSRVRELIAAGGSPRASARGYELPHPRALAGEVTFGSFNVLSKVSPETIGVWGRILAAVPRSRLLLKAAALDYDSVRQRVQRAFESLGIAEDRLELLGRTPDLAEHLELYHRVDIALDTFPYNGTTTTCEALWMGVPVVTLMGRTHASRVGASLLHAVGLRDCVAATAEDYVNTAARLAGDPAARDRATVRRAMENSPLRDEAAFVAGFESALRSAWRSWCAETLSGSGPGTI